MKMLPSVRPTCLLVLCLGSKIHSSDALASPKPPHILSVGLAAVDFVATVDHYPEPDEKMRSSSLVVEGGGNAANTACAIGRLEPFAKASVCTAVGDDANGNTIVDGIKANNVNVLAEEYKGSSPFSYILSTDIDGENTRTCVHQPSSGDMTIDFVEQQIPLEEYTAVHFDVRYPVAAVALARKCVAESVPYSVDTERPREGLDELLAGASVVICNSDYCNTILGRNATEDPIENMRQVMKQQAPNAKIALTTLGGKGSCLVRLAVEASDDEEEDAVILLQDESDSNIPVVTLQKGSLFCSAFGGCNVVDTTGAGDSFIGGFLTAIWNYAASSSASNEVPTDVRVLAHALRVASRVASKKVEKIGARSGLPYAKEDDFILSEMKAMLEL